MKYERPIIELICLNVTEIIMDSNDEFDPDNPEGEIDNE